MPKVLVIDDDASFREVLLFHLADRGIETDAAADGREGLERFDPALHAVVLTDLRMPRMGGMEVLRKIKDRSPDTVVVVITAFGTIEQAVEAMKAGAFDFLPKPCTRDHLLLVIEKALAHHRLHHRVSELENLVSTGGRDLLFRSEAMRRAVALLDKAAPSDATVLLTGESGTGKELFARRLHRKSRRLSGPFVTVNCAAIPRDLLESELFGHARGAFTGATRDRKGRFELASGGTLFLDEVGELPPEIQGKLLRALQERTIDVLGKEAPVPVDVRIVAATNRDLFAAVEAGAFRRDLYYRLNVVTVPVPPLRERPEDIPLLARHFLALFSPDRPLALSAGAERALLAHDWPGNVRELENVCQNLALFTEGDEITEDQLPPLGRGRVTLEPADEVAVPLPEEGLSLRNLERNVIEQALKKNGYNQAKTARYLRIPRHVLLYRIEKYEIPIPGR